MFIRLEPQNSPAAPAIPTVIHHTQVPKDTAKANAAKELPLTPSRVALLSPTPLLTQKHGLFKALAGSLSCTCFLPPTS